MAEWMESSNDIIKEHLELINGKNEREMER